ncbi:MAG: PD40 domain-containing protein [Thermoleophilia bacterium]|nr:PD40 domain-containing protein [Thermoleophilia bacterium]
MGVPPTEEAPLTGRRHLGAALSGAVCATALLAPSATATASPAQQATPLAGAGSILYLQGGALWLASPDGRVKRRVPHAGRFDNPSQADNGTIVAQRGLHLYRMNRRGRLLNRPITTAFRTSAALPAFRGPLWPEVSPDGRKIAYTYSFTATHFDPSCMCTRVSTSLNTSYTWAGRFTADPARTLGLARMYGRASWIDSSSVLLATESLFDFGGNVLDSLAVDRLGGGADSYARWFSECDPCDSLATLRLHRLSEPELTRRRDKLVVVSGPLGGTADGSRMLVYRVNGLPPAMPSGPCHVTGATGRFSSPTWSPDGRSLAWADGRGIWVARVGDLSGPTCELTRRLVVPRGTQPDWGPARPR